MEQKHIFAANLAEKVSQPVSFVLNVNMEAHAEGGATCRGWGNMQGVGQHPGGGATCRGWGSIQGAGQRVGVGHT